MNERVELHIGGEGWRGDIQWARKNISRIICQRSKGRTFKERVVKGAGLLQEKLACTLRVRDKEMITELLLHRSVQSQWQLLVATPVVMSIRYHLQVTPTLLMDGILVDTLRW